MKFLKSLAGIALVLALTASAFAADSKNTLVMKLKSGDVKIELANDVAPKHAERLRSLANKGFYDGLKFHRVIGGFMAQTGDPLGNGTGGSKLADLEQEFSNKPFVRGTVGMARSQNPNSANSQFFIMFADGAFLNGQYTVVGQVSEGMEHVDAIKKGSRSRNGEVIDPDSIVSMRTADKM